MSKLKCLVIPDKLWDELKKEATDRNISISAYVRLILSGRN